MQMRPLDNFYVRVMRRLEPGFKIPVSDKVFDSREELVAYYPAEVMKSYLIDLKDDGKNRDAIIENKRMTLFYNTKNYERMKRAMMNECKAWYLDVVSYRKGQRRDKLMGSKKK